MFKLKYDILVLAVNNGSIENVIDMLKVKYYENETNGCKK